MKNFFINDFQIHANTGQPGIVVFKDHTGLEGADMRMPQYDNPGYDGNTISNWLKGGRPIQLPGRIAAETIADYEILKRSFQNAFKIVRDSTGKSLPLLLKFQTMDDLYLQCEVYLSQAIQFPTKFMNHCTFLVQLYAPDPNLYSQSIINTPLTLPTNTGLIYPVIYPVIYPAAVGGQQIIRNNGDANAPLKITFNGPLTAPFITNVTTGETFAVDVTLQTGDQLIVTTGIPHTMTLNGSGALEHFILSNTWLEIVPGDNLFQLGTNSSSDTGGAIISFQNAYEGA